MSIHWYDIIGVMGVGSIVCSYFLLQVGRLTATNPLYSLFNLVGSMMILTSLFYTFNFASFVIEIFWILISFVGLVRSYRARATSA